MGYFAYLMHEHEELLEHCITKIIDLCSKLADLIPENHIEKYFVLSFLLEDVISLSDHIKILNEYLPAVKHFPTKQISFNILNISGLMNSPYGQCTTTIYRGGGNRSNLTSHCSGTFK